MNQARVKICGITRVQDALVAKEAGADAIGLVFYPPSSRYVADPGLAKEIAQAVGPFVNVVALFVNEEQAQIEQVLKQVPVNLIQFHGDEACRFCENFAVPYIKALRVKDADSLSHGLESFPSAAGILLDTYIKGVPGGTGEAFNWQLVPHNTAQPLVVAGGLNPQNVAEALTQTQAYGVDVSGGVESAPGIKDAEKVKKFIENARSVKN